MTSNKFPIYAIILIIFLGLILYAKNSRGDMLQDYNSEVVEYIETKNGILPEYTKFKCNNGVLYKSGRVQRMYTGKAQTCKVIELTRGDYEDYIVLTLF